MASGMPLGRTLQWLALRQLLLWLYMYKSASCWSQGMASQWKTNLSQHYKFWMLQELWNTTYWSVMLTTLYHCCWTPFSRSSSKLLVHVQWNRDHICSGLMFKWPRFQLCWIELEREGLSAWWMCMCAYATWKFSDPRSLWVTHSAPNYPSDMPQWRIKITETYHQKFWPPWDIVHIQTLDLSCSTRSPTKGSFQWNHPCNHVKIVQNASICHAGPWPKSGSPLWHRRYGGQYVFWFVLLPGQVLCT